MKASSIHFKGHRCFKDHWSGFDAFRPINVIIGRNNTGKSHLLDLVAYLCSPEDQRATWSLRCSGTVDEPFAKEIFPPTTFGGPLHGNHWSDHGAKLVGCQMEWELRNDLSIVKGVLGPAQIKEPNRSYQEHIDTVRQAYLFRSFTGSSLSPFRGMTFRRTLADRDIQPEPATTGIGLLPNGDGATNIIRKCLLSSSDQVSRDLIQTTLLSGLNSVFAHDGSFTEIHVQLHDEPRDAESDSFWEVFLVEKDKPSIPLSKSGSGLKTIILVLLNLLVLPKLLRTKDELFVFAFEELENNLHPSLLRGLLEFVAKHATSHRQHVYLTTHSPVALDLFSGSPEAQIIHVVHDGKSAKTLTATAHLDQLEVLAALGSRPSDLLQANGVLWVEGPSDAIYLKRWIELASDGSLVHGRDYQFAFFGGSLLARTTCAFPTMTPQQLANLMHINPNHIVICDSDKKKESDPLKPRVEKTQGEISNNRRALFWATGTKEIENYLPGEVLGAWAGLGTLRNPGQYEGFFPAKRSRKSFLKDEMKTTSVQKADLASAVCPRLTKSMMEARFDWTESMNKIVEHIRSWNRR